jgi:hypothetical protein
VASGSGSPLELDLLDATAVAIHLAAAAADIASTPALVLLLRCSISRVSAAGAEGPCYGGGRAQAVQPVTLRYSVPTAAASPKLRRGGGACARGLHRKAAGEVHGQARQDPQPCMGRPR